MRKQQIYYAYGGSAITVQECIERYENGETFLINDGKILPEKKSNDDEAVM